MTVGLPHKRKQDGHQTSGVGAVREATKNPPATANIPVLKGPKGLCYDVGKVADEGRRKRIIANRESAKISRQRRLDDARAMHCDLARLGEENTELREANRVLKRRITEVQTALKHFHSFAPFANEFGMSPLPAPATLASMFSGELLDTLRQRSSVCCPSLYMPMRDKHTE